MPSLATAARGRQPEEVRGVNDTFSTTSLILAAAIALAMPSAGSAEPGSGKSAVACPTITPLHGLLPILIWTGLMPRPAMARTIAASDVSTSIVIRPDKSDQITCGKTAITTTNDVIFATRSRPDGKSVDLSLDIQVPRTPGKKPLVVYITGGGFIMAPKEAALNLRTYVAEAGFVVASIEYRTTRNGASYRDGVADVKSAIRYLRKNADRYGIDSRKVAVWGESAGGYLAAMVGVTNNIKAFDVGADLEQSSDVQAVVDKFGVSDASKLAADFDPQAQEADNAADSATARYIGMAPGTHVLDLRIATTAANPITYVNETVPPFLLFHGSQDRLVSPSQTLMLHRALRAAGGHSTRYVLDGAGHGDLSFLGDRESGLPWSTRQTMWIIVDFLQRSIGSGPH
jgi:acetyl esterase/lipase